MSERLCPECGDGCGYTVESRIVPECCRNATATGECCGDPVAGQELEQVECRTCAEGLSAATERARIVAAVEGLQLPFHAMAPLGFGPAYKQGHNAALDLVLAAITDTTPRVGEETTG